MKRLINESFYYYEPYFNVCDRHPRDLRISYNESIICNRAINEYRLYEYPLRHNGALIGDWDGDQHLNITEFTLTQNIFQTALAMASLRFFDLDRSSYLEPREDEKEVFCKFWSIILDMPEYMVLNTFEESDVRQRDGALTVRELLIFHANLDAKFAKEKMISEEVDRKNDDRMNRLHKMWNGIQDWRFGFLKITQTQDAAKCYNLFKQAMYRKQKTFTLPIRKRNRPTSLKK